MTPVDRLGDHAQQRGERRDEEGRLVQRADGRAVAQDAAQHDARDVQPEAGEEEGPGAVADPPVRPQPGHRQQEEREHVQVHAAIEGVEPVELDLEADLPELAARGGEPLGGVVVGGEVVAEGAGVGLRGLHRDEAGHHPELVGGDLHPLHRGVDDVARRDPGRLLLLGAARRDEVEERAGFREPDHASGGRLARPSGRRSDRPGPAHCRRRGGPARPGAGAARAPCRGPRGGERGPVRRTGPSALRTRRRAPRRGRSRARARGRRTSPSSGRARRCRSRRGSAASR